MLSVDTRKRSVNDKRQFVVTLIHKTVIMVAHRLSTVQDADQILVMKNGAIAESGTHSDLIKHQGEYAKMWDNYNKTVQWHIES